MINIFKINKEKFKSIYFSFNFTMPVNEKENSENAVLASVLEKSCEKYKTQKEIQMYLSGLYGSNFDINVEKFGDLYNIEFRGECINKKFLPKNEDVSLKLLEFIYNIIYLPDITDSKFNDEIVKREKEVILDKIHSRKDDKLVYAVSKTEELLCKEESFGYYLYGNENIVEKITVNDLYKRYLGVIGSSCITIIVSGNLENYDNIEENIKQIFLNKIDSKRDYINLLPNSKEIIQKKLQLKEIEEKQQTSQSILTFGLRVKKTSSRDFYIANVYNSILGGNPSSKLFQNFREKDSLAYTVRSRYYRYKSIIVIYAGIQKDNYKKAKEVIKREILNIEKGNISKEEFEASKQSIISDLKEWNDSKIALSKMFISNLISFKNIDVTLETIIDEIKKVTLQDVKELAKRVELEIIYLLGGEEDV